MSEKPRFRIHLNPGCNPWPKYCWMMHLSPQDNGVLIVGSVGEPYHTLAYRAANYLADHGAIPGPAEEMPLRRWAGATSPRRGKLEL